MRFSPSVMAFGTMLLASTVITPVQAQTSASVADNGSSLPYPPPRFTGRLGPTVQQSTPDYGILKDVQAPAGTPNILLIMTDDTGFGAAGTFGGPVPTPNLSKLAEDGAIYNNFQTEAICSATRASLLTGRNPHVVGMGVLSDIASPYPGYTGMIPQNADTIADALKDNGYATAMFGKDHDTPSAEESAAGPFVRWPSGLGFQYFYGFVGGDADQFQPNLYENNVPVNELNRPKGYMLDNDLANHAIAWIHEEKAAAPDKPFFIYYAPGSTHSPQQAPAGWIAKFKGQFVQGWNQQRVETLQQEKMLGIVPQDTDLSPWPAEVPKWDTLTAAQKIIDSRYMEVYAAQLAYQDAQIGRVLNAIKKMGLDKNTIIIFIEGDNGASGEGGINGTLDELIGMSQAPADERVANPQWLVKHLNIMGGPHTYETYPAGWALAMDTPFPWTKQIASHLGGLRDGMVISWPGHIKDTGTIRTQFGTVTDIMPTLLQVAHVKVPTQFNGLKQLPLDGTSLAYTFGTPDAPPRQTVQYFEMMGNRAIYQNGWLANTAVRNMPWDIAHMRPNSNVNSYRWEVFDLNKDYSQSHNLASKYPARLKAMQALFDEQARKYNVYPIMDSGLVTRAMQTAMHADIFKPQYTYWGSDIYMPVLAAPPIFQLPFSIEAIINVPKSGANGVIVAAGSWFGGWSFYLRDGKPTAYASASNLPGMQTRIEAPQALPAGDNTMRFVFEPDNGEGGALTIWDNGKKIAQGHVAHRPVMMAGTTETFDIGRDRGVPVTDDYQNEGVFTGTIDKVVVDIKKPPIGTILKKLIQMKMSQVLSG